MCRGLCHTTSLTSIDLGWSDLRGGGAEIFAGSLRHTPHLASLNLGSITTPLEIGGAELLSLGLRSLPGLTTFNVEYHRFGPEGVAVLAAELRRTAPRLVSLALRENMAGDAGAEAVAEALPHWPRLKILQLNGNGIGDAGAARLADALHRVTALTWLNLSSNVFGAAGAGRLVAAYRTVASDLILQIG
jgi:Ran GTPase-activating protein (RanGAP) involved in mRNA processing and transport